MNNFNIENKKEVHAIINFTSKLISYNPLINIYKDLSTKMTYAGEFL